MEVPFSKLSPEALNNLIIDFVSGTDDSGADIPLTTKINQIKTQLTKGSIFVSFDPESESCSIVTRI